jgi:hypothetical protein
VAEINRIIKYMSVSSDAASDLNKYDSGFKSGSIFKGWGLEFIPFTTVWLRMIE